MAQDIRADCLFCLIIAGESPTQMVYQDEAVVAFRDKFPKAPIHILIVPREHIPSLAQVGQEHSDLLARMMLLANRLAREEGIAERGYRLVANSGLWAGQAIPHLHFHLMGGKALRWEH